MAFPKSFFDNSPTIIGEYNPDSIYPTQYLARAKLQNAGRSTKFNAITKRFVNLKSQTFASPLIRDLLSKQNFKKLIYDPTLSKHLKSDTNDKMEPSDLRIGRYRTELISQLLEDDSQFSGYALNEKIPLDIRKKTLISRFKNILRGIIVKQYSQLKQQKIELNREYNLSKLPTRGNDGSTRIMIKTWFANNRNTGNIPTSSWIPKMESENEKYPNSNYSSLMM